ncbi:Uncharacterised protein [Segatella copri]|nr:Uncharacterised protein [Segatella copri]
MFLASVTRVTINSETSQMLCCLSSSTIQPTVPCVPLRSLIDSNCPEASSYMVTPAGEAIHKMPRLSFIM